MLHRAGSGQIALCLGCHGLRNEPAASFYPQQLKERNIWGAGQDSKLSISLNRKTVGVLIFIHAIDDIINK